MTNKVNRQIQELCEFKRFARKEGQAWNSPNKIREMIKATDFPSGDVAEVWMVYMLGLFSVIADDGLKIYTTTALDKEGTDFLLKRFGMDFHIQQKFCIKNKKYYPSHIRVVEIGAWKGFEGLTELPSCTGSYAVFRILEESGAYDEEELYDLFEENEEFVQLCNKVWTYIKN